MHAGKEISVLGNMEDEESQVSISALVLPSLALLLGASHLTPKLLSHLYTRCWDCLFSKAISKQKNATALPRVITETTDTKDS